MLVLACVGLPWTWCMSLTLINGHIYLLVSVHLSSKCEWVLCTSLCGETIISHPDTVARGRESTSTLVTLLGFLIPSAFRQAFPGPGGWCGPTTEVIAFPLSHLSRELIENPVMGLQDADNNKIIMILLAIWPQCWFLFPEKHCHVNRKTHQSQKSHQSQANWLEFTHSIADETGFRCWGAVSPGKIQLAP